MPSLLFYCLNICSCAKIKILIYRERTLKMGSLGFVLGTAAVDHQQVLIDQLADQLRTAPAGDTFFYIVPNHIKFETEIHVLAGLRARQGKSNQERFAANRVQVLSFSRLAWFLLRDTPLFRRTRLSKIGMAMLTTKILQEHRDELHLYASEIQQPGFVQKLTAQLEELQSSNITADDFATIIQQAQADPNIKVSPVWSAKMHDVALIYRSYELRLQKHFLGNNELYQQLAQYFYQEPTSQHLHFFIDRFTQFTAGEQQIVDAIILNAASTTISLTLDRGYPDQRHPSTSELPNRNSLFYPAAMQYHRLWKFARAHPKEVQLLNNVVYAQCPRVSADLQEFDHFFRRYAVVPLDLDAGHPLARSSSIQIQSVPNRFAELNNVATQIRQLVASGKYRYRDFLILSRHLDGYQTMIAPVFHAHQVPIFNDHERRMDNHPLVVLLLTLLKIPLHGYRTADIIQLLKTWLLLPAGVDQNQLTEAVFTTENWCLKQAIEGKHAWVTHDSQEVTTLWRVKGTNLTRRQKRVNDQLNLIRTFVGQTLVPFFDSLKKIQTGRELATKLYQFLTDNGVTDRLYAWQQYQADTAGNLDLARQPKQVWSTFCQILQEYVTILGDQQVGNDSREALLTNFSELLQAGFAAAQYSQIPATLDQVVISETGIVQSQSHRIVFVIGATDDVMPEAPDDDTLLTDSDRDILSQYLDQDCQYLPATTSDQLAAEPLLHYQGFMSAQERLILSAPQFGDEGKELQMSPYLRDTARYFQINIDRVPLVTSPAGQQAAERFVSAPVATTSQLVQVMRQLSDDQGVQLGQRPQLPLGWRRVAGVLAQLAKHDPVLRERFRVIHRGFAYHNQTKNISSQMAQALYLHTTVNGGKRVLYASISQLQDFYVNQYEYFLKYGLRLKKRDELAMSTDRIGTYFHRAMEVFVNLVRQSNFSFADLSQKVHQSDLARFTSQALDAADQSQPELLRLVSASAQARFQYQQLTTIVKTMLQTLCQQAANAHFVPRATEIQFGQIGDQGPAEFAALDYPLDGHRHIHLRGRIDRVDQIDVDHNQYLTVVDYKSGDRTFDLTAAYYGLSLQLLTYLSGLQANLGKLNLTHADLAGALYLHLNNPTISATKLAKVSPLHVKQRLTTLRLKAHQYKGILLNNPTLLNNLAQKGKADLVYPLHKNLKPGKGALLVTPDQLKWLQDNNRRLIVAAGQAILSGQLKLNPYRLVDGSTRQTGLDYTDYLDIYQFDNMLDQGLYHVLDAQIAREKFDQAQHHDDGKGED